MKHNQLLFLIFLAPFFVHSQSIDLESFGNSTPLTLSGGVSANSVFYSSEVKYYLKDFDEEIAEDELPLAGTFYRNREIGENTLGKLPEELKNKYHEQLIKKGEILAEAKWTQFEEEFGDLLGDAKEAFKADFANSTELLDEFAKNPELVDAWKKMENLGADGALRRNLGALEALSKPQFERPLDPSTYLSKEYIDKHLAKFEGGVTKFSASTPTRSVGPPEGTYVIPKSLADELLAQADGKVEKLEEFLGLEEGILGKNPVRIDIDNPTGLRMPNGNERGANGKWLPGGKTSGGILEATVDQIPLEKISNNVKPAFK